MLLYLRKALAARGKDIAKTRLSAKICFWMPNGTDWKKNLQSMVSGIEHFSGELDLDIPPPLIRRKNSNRVEYNVHFSSYVGTFSIFPFIFRQKEKSHRPSDQ